jgi:hypothetical protein
MPAEVLRDPLALKLSLPGGTPTVIVIGDLPNPKLAADLTEGLAASIHPHGPLAKLTTVKSCVGALLDGTAEPLPDGPPSIRHPPTWHRLPGQRSRRPSTPRSTTVSQHFPACSDRYQHALPQSVDIPAHVLVDVA